MPRDRPIYIIDDEPEMCRSLELLLALEDFETRSFPSVEAFIRDLPRLPLGIILSDVALGGRSGLELLQTLPSLDRSDPVILITGHGDITMAVTAMKSGAADLLEKPFEAQRLLGAVTAVCDRILRSTTFEKCLASLSHRERQVLRQIIEGLTAKQIATRLDISPRTVETYREHLMRKTGATSLAQLVRFGVEARIACTPLTPPRERQPGDMELPLPHDGADPG